MRGIAVRAGLIARLASPVVMALTFAAAVTLGLWASSRPSLSSLLVVAIGIVIAIPIVVRLIEGSFDPFEPTVIFALVYGTLFVVRPAAMIANDDYSFPFTPGFSIEPTFDRMLVLALLGAVCFVAGYAMPLGSRLAALAPRPPLEFERRTATTSALAVAGIGVLAFFVLAARAGGLSVVLGGRSLELHQLLLETSSYLSLGATLAVGPSVLLFALYMQRRTRAMLLLTVAVTLFVVVARGSFGSRYDLVPLFVGMLVLWFVSRDRRPSLVTGVAVILLALVASAVLVHGRTAGLEASGREAGSDYKAGLVKVFSNPSSTLDPIVKSEDASMAPAVAAAMTVIPQRLDYGYGRYVAIDLVTRGVPRATWPGKPQPPHSQVSRTIAPRPGDEQQAPIAFSVLLHGYLDFGLAGALWLVAFGLGFRSLYEWFRIHSRSMPAMLIFALSISLIPFAVRDNPVDTAVRAASVFVPIAVAYWLTVRRTARS